MNNIDPSKRRYMPSLYVRFICFLIVYYLFSRTNDGISIKQCQDVMFLFSTECNICIVIKYQDSSSEKHSVIGRAYCDDYCIHTTLGLSVLNGNLDSQPYVRNTRVDVSTSCTHPFLPALHTPPCGADVT